MKVILLQHVAKIGQRFEVKDVADGYALNYLIPRKLAEPATKKKIVTLEMQRKAAAGRAQVQAKLMHEELQKLAGKTVTLTARANEQGHLFKGLHVDDVAAAIKKEAGAAIPTDAIHLKDPIKEIGEHTLTVSLGGEETPLTLVVEAEK